MATGPNGRENYNRYGLISAKYDNDLATWFLMIIAQMEGDF